MEFSGLIFFVLINCISGKNETDQVESRGFLFSRPQLQGGLIGVPVSPFLGSVSLPLERIRGTQILPNALLGRVGVTSPTLQNPLLRGIGTTPGITNPFLRGVGTNGITDSLLREVGPIPGFTNPLLGGVKTTPGIANSLLGKVGPSPGIQNFGGGGLRALPGRNGINEQYLNQLLNNNKLNGLQSPTVNQNSFNQENLFNHQQRLMAMHQLQQLQHLGLLDQQRQLPPVLKDLNPNVTPLLQTTDNDALMELMILQYILGKDGLKDILGDVKFASARDSAFGARTPIPRQNGINFPRRNPSLNDRPIRRILGSSSENSEISYKLPVNRRSGISTRVQPYRIIIPSRYGSTNPTIFSLGTENIRTQHGNNLLHQLTKHLRNPGATPSLDSLSYQGNRNIGLKTLSKR